MRIFISHSSKNKEVVLEFARLLESLSSDISVFCSSSDGSIKVGSNFVSAILKELNDCDLFIPIISNDFYKSRFAMTELGIACCFLFEKYSNDNIEYIYPFALFPVKSGYALSGTPIAHLQAGDLNNKEHLHSFINSLASDKNIRLTANTNNKISSFVYSIDKMLLSMHSLLIGANPGTFFDDSILFKNRADIVQHSLENEELTVNFNLNPYELPDAKLPNFVSLALLYVDNIDLGRYLELDASSKLEFTFINFSNSLRNIIVEFKHGEGNKLLKQFTVAVAAGDNAISIPLSNMKCEALHNISEICFVVHPEDVVENEGMFKICNLQVSFSK